MSSPKGLRLLLESYIVDDCNSHSSRKKNGTIKIATDIDDYAAQILGIMKKKKNFDLINSNLIQSKIANRKNFNTKYEKKAIDSGRNTNYLIFKKTYEYS